MNRPRTLFVVTALVLLSVVSVGAVGIAAADDGAPGEPASFYGTVTEDNGTQIPAGVTIVAVVDGETEDSIEVETSGSYGGPGTFDDKLRIDSAAGDEVTFRFDGGNESVGGTAPLESGLHEKNLTFPDGSVDSLPPEPEIDLDPADGTAEETITFSAAESTAYGDTELVAFEWSVERDDKTIDTFAGETVDRSIDEGGEYDVVLNVTGDNNLTAVETTETVIDATESEDETTAGGFSTGGGSGGGTGGTGGTGSLGGSDGGSTETDGSSSTDGSGSTDGSDGSGELTESVDATSQPIFSETHSIEDQFPGASGSSVVFEETTIREIVFEDRPVPGEISIEEFEEPIAAPPIPENGRVASASVITVPEEYRETNATVRAVVSDEWMDERGLVSENLTMYRLPTGGDSWQALPTETFEIDGGYTVEATTPGFSQFVVAGSVPPSRADGGVDTSGNDLDATTDRTSAGSDASEPDDGTSPDADDESGFGETTPFVPVAALCALLVVVAAVGRLLVPRRRNDW